MAPRDLLWFRQWPIEVLGFPHLRIEMWGTQSQCYPAGSMSYRFHELPRYS
jgi:hypothetical protein